MRAPRIQELNTRRDTQRLAQRTAEVARPGDLILLEGGLGAGKTFFTRALARAWGLPPTIAVTSPTFTLVQEYETPRGLLVHADLYRLLESSVDLEREVANLGLRERRHDGALVVVEWGRDAEPFLGGATLTVQLMLRDDGSRVVAINGDRAGLLTL